MLNFWIAIGFSLLTPQPGLGGDLPRPSNQEPVARVVVVETPGATHDFVPRPDKVSGMVQRGLTNLTGEATLAKAWLSLVTTQDTVGIKVVSAPGPMSGTRRVVVEAVVEGLLAAGLKPSQIIVWSRRLPDLSQAGFTFLTQKYGVRVAGCVESGYDESVFYETALLGRLVYGDHEFGRKGVDVGRRSYVSRLVSKEITKIISIVPLLNHNDAGITGHLFATTLASVDNTLRFETDPGRLALALPEIYAMREIGDRVVLNITDALVCQYFGEEKTMLHYASMMNQLWFSKDPIALDVTGLDELARARQNAQAPAGGPYEDIYSNAALLDLGVADRRRIRVETLK